MLCAIVARSKARLNEANVPLHVGPVQVFTSHSDSVPDLKCNYSRYFNVCFILSLTVYERVPNLVLVE